MPTCETCKYRHPLGEQVGNVGECRRNPPTAMLVPFRIKPTPTNPEGIVTGTQSHFPPVNGEMWCGMYMEVRIKLESANRPD